MPSPSEIFRSDDIYLIFVVETCQICYIKFCQSTIFSQFGIQARGGCACAGPYAQRLLGMTQEAAKMFSELLKEEEEAKAEAEAEASCHCNGLQCPTDNINSEFHKPGERNENF